VFLKLAFMHLVEMDSSKITMETAKDAFQGVRTV
jgi:hypothetical protein